MVEWNPYNPPRLWTTPGRPGEPDYEVELFEPDFTDGKRPPGRYGLAIGVYQFGSFRFMVEMWTNKEAERESLERQASAQVDRMVLAREWMRRPDSRHAFWLYRGGTASRRRARRKPRAANAT